MPWDYTLPWEIQGHLERETFHWIQTYKGHTTRRPNFSLLVHSLHGTTWSQDHWGSLSWRMETSNLEKMNAADSIHFLRGRHPSFFKSFHIPGWDDQDHTECAKSGLCISMQKSRIFFGLTVERATRQNISSILRIQATGSLGNYLGIPMNVGRRSYDDFRFLIDKLNSKLTDWTSRHLSFAGRILWFS